MNQMDSMCWLTLALCALIIGLHWVGVWAQQEYKRLKDE